MRKNTTLVILGVIATIGGVIAFLKYRVRGSGYLFTVNGNTDRVTVVQPTTLHLKVSGIAPGSQPNILFNPACYGTTTVEFTMPVADSTGTSTLDWPIAGAPLVWYIWANTPNAPNNGLSNCIQIND